MSTALALIACVEPTPPSPLPINTLIVMALSGVVSPHTHRVYSGYLNRFLLSNHPLTRVGVQTWVRGLRVEGLGSSGVNQALAAVRKLAEEAHAHGVLTVGEWAGIKGVKGDKVKGMRAGNWLTLDQLTALLLLPDNSLMGIRDSALLAVLTGCGLRREEVAALPITAYKDIGGRKVFEVFGKGRKMRVVPIPEWVERRVDRWVGMLVDQAGVNSASQYVATLPTAHPTALFRSFKGAGEKVGETGLGPQGVYWVVCGYGERLGISALRPHDLRRTFSKLAKEGGAEVEQISKVLGHSSVAVTERYLGGGVELGKGKGAGDYIRP